MVVREPYERLKGTTQKRICTKCGLRFYSARFVCPSCNGKAITAKHSQEEVNDSQY